MALAPNMKSKKAFNKILPDWDTIVSAHGVTVISERLTTPRFIPFDNQGKCKNCVEVGGAAGAEGIYLDCSRMNEIKFIPYDIIYELPHYGIFRVKCKGRVYTIPYHISEPVKKDQEVKDEQTVEVAMPASIEGIQSPNFSLTLQGSTSQTEEKTELPTASEIDKLFAEYF